MKQIGECVGGKVFYGNGIVSVEHTNIWIIGVKDEQDAIKKAELNLIGFHKA